MKLLSKIMLTVFLLAMEYANYACAAVSDEARLPFRVMDIRHGLPESRIRGIAQLSDGRMVFLSPGNLTVYDWSGRTSIRIDESKIVALPSYHSYKRMMVDDLDKVWVKDDNRLFAFDATLGQQLDASGIIKELECDSIGNFFASKDGWYVCVSTSGDLYFRNSGGASFLLGNIADTPFNQLERAEKSGSRLILCYRAGLIIGYDIALRKRLFQETLTDAEERKKAFKGVYSCMIGDTLAVSVNYEGYKDASLAFYDTGNQRQISKVDIPFHINDMLLMPEGRVLVAGDSLAAIDRPYSSVSMLVCPVAPEVHGGAGHSPEIYCLYRDMYGSLWLGSLEAGILYRGNSDECIVKMYSSPYPYSRVPVFCSPRAARLAERYAPGITNCSYLSPDSTLFLGTRNGLIVIGKDDDIITTITQEDGLDADNVHAVTSDSEGRLWLTTPSGINMLKRISDSSFRITVFGVLDGLSLEGREFRPNELCVDSSGFLCASFAGGHCVISLSDSIPPRYYSLSGSRMHGDDASGNVWPIAAGVVVALVLVVCVFYPKMRRVAKDRAADTESESVQDRMKVDNTDFLKNVSAIESRDPDRDFLLKVKEAIENNISDPDFTVERLSGILAMDRITLFRKMKRLTEFTPSNYIREVRMIRAESLLLSNSNLPISEIAYSVGFGNPKYFTQLFRERFGATPSEYRKGRIVDSSEKDDKI